jgi:hypothetical protein
MFQKAFDKLKRSCRLLQHNHHGTLELINIQDYSIYERRCMKCGSKAGVVNNKSCKALTWDLSLLEQIAS